jgi:hypothetical protein
MASGIEEGTIDTLMPAHDHALVLARLEVAAVGGMLDLGIDEIADLRLATEELCLLVLAEPRTSQGRLHLTLRWDESMVEVATTIDPDDVPFDARVPSVALPSTLSSQILAALTDEHGVDGVPGASRAWFRKKRATT